MAEGYEPDHYIREDVRTACSKSWKHLVDAELRTAASIEDEAVLHPAFGFAAKMHFRRALAVERMHQMVQKGLIPTYNYMYERWENPD